MRLRSVLSALVLGVFVPAGSALAADTYKIDPVHEVYVPAGTFTEVVETSEPWEMGMTISSLTPRYL